MVQTLEQRRGREAAGLGRLRAPKRIPEPAAAMVPGPEAPFPFLEIIRIAKRIASFLHRIFFTQSRWDTRPATVGHRSRQPLRGQLVCVKAARLAGARYVPGALQGRQI